MGTKVQRESYLSIDHLIMNLEKDSNNCSRPLFYGDKHCNDFPPRSTADSFSTCDKKVLVKTMLKHEAVFKSQIYELHSMYRIQKNLMDDLERKESNRSRTAVETSFSSSPLASQITYGDARSWQMPGFPSENNLGCVGTSISGVEDINHFILSSKKGSNHQLGNSQNGYGLKDVQNRPVKVRRKLIDLHLPADAYIDTEETTDAVCGRSNGNVIKEAQGDSLRPGSGLRSTNCLANLNEPFNGETRLHDKEPFPKKFPHSDDNGCRTRWPPQVHGSGNYTGSKKSASLFLQQEKSPHSSHFLSNNLHERQCFSVVNASDVHSWKEREFIDLEANPRNGGIILENHLENPNSRLARTTVSARGLPFLTSPEILSDNANSVGRFGDKWHCENISRMNSVASSVSSNQKGFDHGSSSFSREYLSNCPSIGYNYQNGRKNYDRFPENFKNHFFKDSNRRETTTVRDLNLNVEFSKNSTNEARDIGEQPGPLPWLQPKPSCNGETIRQRDLNASYSGVLSSSRTNLDDSVKTFDRVWSQSLKSVYSSNNVEPRKLEANDCSTNRKVFGCTISDKTCYKDREASPKVDLNRVFDINLPSEPAVPASEEDQSIDNQTDTKIAASFRHHIDLNLSVCEDKDSFTPLGARLDVNVPEIDLEVPAVHEIEEFDVCGENSPERSSGKANKSLDEIVKIAAEAMVAFSLSAHDSSDEVACSTQQASGSFLHLFAETINSYGENLDRNLEAFSINKGNGVNRVISSSDRTDYFESMTLRLAEMKEEDYMPKPMIPENIKLDETGPSLPSQRPKRGNARRGRPRRDFQRNILPGLASLARLEVTEDIQTFCGLMRATGHDWKAGLAKRKSGSKRGRPRLVPANPNQSIPSPQNPGYPSRPPQPLTNSINRHNNIETGLEDRSITGWGNMTRRSRRQRCPPGNNGIRSR